MDPVAVSPYVEALGQGHAPTSVKQHLAAVKVFFNHLVSGGVLDTNPAAAVRGPRYSLRQGKTPVLYEEDARARGCNTAPWFSCGRICSAEERIPSTSTPSAACSTWA